VVFKLKLTILRNAEVRELLELEPFSLVVKYECLDMFKESESLYDGG